MKSQDKLKQYLKEKYIKNSTMGSPNVSCAIRDLLTDLLYIGKEYNIDIQSRLLDAEEVFAEEIS